MSDADRGAVALACAVVRIRTSPASARVLAIAGWRLLAQGRRVTGGTLAGRGGLARPRRSSGAGLHVSDRLESDCGRDVAQEVCCRRSRFWVGNASALKCRSQRGAHEQNHADLKLGPLVDQVHRGELACSFSHGGSDERMDHAVVVVLPERAVDLMASGAVQVEHHAHVDRHWSWCGPARRPGRWRCPRSRRPAWCRFRVCVNIGMMSGDERAVHAGREHTTLDLPNCTSTPTSPGLTVQAMDDRRALR